MKTTINQQAYEFEVQADETAVDVIRDKANLTGTKFVCGAGVCGACTVIVDDKPVCSCLYPANLLEGKSVRTVENQGRDNLHPVQKALMAHDGLQCGYCTPGFVNAGIAFYETWRKSAGKTKPNRDTVAAALAGNLCRCGSYIGIYAAIQAACVGDFDDVSLDDLEYSRVDALPKVTGEAKYTTDKSFDGMLHARVLRSIHPRAKIRSVDFSEALKMDGVVTAVETLRQSDRTVNYVGDRIAAVAAVDVRTADAALKKIKVDYEILPAVTDWKKSQAATNSNAEKSLRKTDISAIGSDPFPGRWVGNTRTNIIPLVDVRGGRAKRRVRRARGSGTEFLHETTFESGAQAHTPLEPHGYIATWEGDRLVMHVASQGGNFHRQDLAKALGLKLDQIDIYSDFVGGAFGGRGELDQEYLIVAQLAKESGKTVKLILDREEVITVGGIRGAASGTVSLLTNESADLDALEIDAFNYNGYSIYNVTAFTQAKSYLGAKSGRFRDHDVASNTPYPKPFRGPGGINGAFALEATIDKAAEHLGVDPIELRKKWDKNGQDEALYEYLQEIPAWQARDQVRSDRGRYRRGVGLGVGHWLHFYNKNTEATVVASADGIKTINPGQEVGQGAVTVAATAVSESFGLKPRDPFISVEMNKTQPGKGIVKAGGSTQSTSLYAPTQQAAAEVQTQITTAVTEKLGLKGNVSHSAEGIKHANGMLSWKEALKACGDQTFTATAKRQRDVKQDGIVSYIDADGHGLTLGYGASTHVLVSEVEVDTELGTIKVIRTYSAVGIGRVFVPELAKSQIYGGITQGIGYTLYEDWQVDKATGQIITTSLEDCRLPGIGDMPEMNVVFMEHGFDHSRSGGIGIGEAAMVPVAASIAAAVKHAIGWQPTELPIRPAHVLEAMAEMA